MRCCTLLILAVLAAALCTSASAARIYTTPSGDGAIETVIEVPSMGIRSTASVVDLSSFTITLPDPNWGFEPHACNGFRVGIFVFDTRSLAGRTLAPGSATLKVYGQLDTAGWNWQHCSQDWGPDVSYGHMYSRTGAVVAPVVNTPGWISLDVTAWLQQDINNGFNNSAFALAPTSQYASLTGKFWASESGTGPYLEVVPEPSCILGLLCGLGGLGALAWRRAR